VLFLPLQPVARATATTPIHTKIEFLNRIEIPRRRRQIERNCSFLFTSPGIRFRLTGPDFSVNSLTSMTWSWPAMKLRSLNLLTHEKCGLGAVDTMNL
jgi:hypothetical protein